MTDNAPGTGLTRKFTVSRVDPEAQQRHPDCRYFVLDIDHDPNARPALIAYANSVAASEPALAEDLRCIAADPDPVAIKAEQNTLRQAVLDAEQTAITYEAYARENYGPGTAGRSANLAEAIKYHEIANRYRKLIPMLEERPTTVVDDNVCPEGCGCRKGTDDADSNDCACGGPYQHDPAYQAPEGGPDEQAHL